MACVLLPTAAVSATAEGLEQLVDIGIALTTERDLSVLLERIVAEARRITKAEAGTLFLREGAALRFAVVQNAPLARRLGSDEVRRRLATDVLPLEVPSLAGFVATTGESITLADAYALPAGSRYSFNATFDARNDYRTRSVLVLALHDPAGDVVGVLQLINARDANGSIVAFDARSERFVRALASQAAMAIRNARLEELVFKDPLTGAYNRRYFTLRIDEEAKRHARLGHPMSLVLVDLDDFKPVNDRHGHQTGDQVLRDVTRVLIENSKNVSIVTRYGGDEFAILMVNTPKAAALRHADRIKGLVQSHTFQHGRLTASIGVASLPDDVACASDLMPVADRALYAAKRLGRNTIQSA